MSISVALPSVGRPAATQSTRLSRTPAAVAQRFTSSRPVGASTWFPPRRGDRVALGCAEAVPAEDAGGVGLGGVGAWAAAVGTGAAGGAIATPGGGQSRSAFWQATDDSTIKSTHLMRRSLHRPGFSDS